MVLINEFSDGALTGKVHCENGVFMVEGQVRWTYLVNVAQLTYAAADPMDLRLGVSASGLPFANKEMAYNGRNSGVASLDTSGRFKFMLVNPNSYYTQQGRKLNTPHLHLTLQLQNGSNRHYDVDLGSGLPLRSLTNYPGMPYRTTER